MIEAQFPSDPFDPELGAGRRQDEGMALLFVKCDFLEDLRIRKLRKPFIEKPIDVSLES